MRLLRNVNPHEIRRRRWIWNARRWASNPPGILSSADRAVKVAALGRLGRRGRWQEALAEFVQLKKNGVVMSPSLANSVITACGRNSRWTQACAILNSMSDFCVSASVVSFGAAIAACENGGAWRGALDLVSSMRANTLAPDVKAFNSAIAACGRGGQWAWALELFDQIGLHGFRAQTVSFSTLISALARSSRYDRLDTVLDWMRDATVKPDLICYNSMLSARAQAGDVERATSLLADITNATLTADVVSYMAVIVACESKGRWASVLAVLDSMADATVVPDSKLGSKAISVCQKAGRWTWSLLILNTLEKARMVPDAITYDAVLSACEKSDQWRAATRLLNQMEVFGPAPNADSYDIVLLALSKSFAWQAGIHVLGGKSDKGFEHRRNTLSATVRLLNVPGVPAACTGWALSQFQADAFDINRRDLEDAARRLDESCHFANARVAGQLCDVPTKYPKSLRQSVAHDIRKFIENLLGEQQQIHNRSCDVLRELEGQLANIFQSVQVEPYGSALEGTGALEADLDVSVKISQSDFHNLVASTAPKRTAHSAALRRIEAAVHGWSGWRVESIALNAKVPVLTLRKIVLGVKVDVCVDNDSAVRQSRTIAEQMTAELRGLVVFVKLWARRRLIYGKSRGRLGGFAFSQMAAFSCQVRGETSDVAEMLNVFFYFYGHDFDWSKECVSVDAGRRSFKSGGVSQDSPHLSIEDPFDLRQDAAGTGLLASESEMLRTEIARAGRLLQDPGATVSDILKPKRPCCPPNKSMPWCSSAR